MDLTEAKTVHPIKPDYFKSIRFLTSGSQTLLPCFLMDLDDIVSCGRTCKFKKNIYCHHISIDFKFVLPVLLLTMQYNAMHVLQFRCRNWC